MNANPHPGSGPLCRPRSTASLSPSHAPRWYVRACRCRPGPSPQAKMIRMSTSNCFDVRRLNVESQNDTNVKHQTVLTFNIKMSNVKLF